MDMKKAYLLFCKAVQDYNIYFYMFEFESESEIKKTLKIFFYLLTISPTANMKYVLM